MSSAPYTDTYLIECNRATSVEANGGNNSQFHTYTNKQGTGLQLNNGDKVSIHSAMVNEIGNTDGTIEIKGDVIKNDKGEIIKYKLTETKTYLSGEYPLDDVALCPNNSPWAEMQGETPQAVPITRVNLSGANTFDGGSKVQLNQPYGYTRADVKNVENEYSLRDDEMNLQMSYYKTTNGENYIHLPRVFDMADSVAMADTTHATLNYSPPAKISARMGTDEHQQPFAYTGTNDSTTSYANYKISDGFVGESDSIYRGATRIPRKESRVPCEWKYYTIGNDYAMSSNNDGVSTISGTRTWDTPPCINTNLLQGHKQTRIWRRVNDNSKYMIFKKEKTFFTPLPEKITLPPPNEAKVLGFLTEKQRAFPIAEDSRKGTYVPNAQGDYQYTDDFMNYVENSNGTYNTNPHFPTGTDYREISTGDITRGYNYRYKRNLRDPAQTGTWFPYYEIKNIKLDKGFHSPEDIAEQVSQQLNRTDEPEDIYGAVGDWTYHQTGTGAETNNPEDAFATDKTPNNTTRIHHKVGLKKDGECFKHFYSTNHKLFNTKTAKEYFVDSRDNSTLASGTWEQDFGTAPSPPDKTPDMNGNCCDYMSAYHYIGVRRPSFFKTGRDLQITYDRNYTQQKYGEAEEKPVCKSSYIARAITFEDRATAEIFTDILWDDRELVKAFVESQGEYPELFDYPYTNIHKTGSDFRENVSVDKFHMGDKDTGRTYARFLHCDVCSEEDPLYNAPPDYNEPDTSVFERGHFNMGSDNYEGVPQADWTRHKQTALNTAGGIPDHTAKKYPPLLNSGYNGANADSIGRYQPQPDASSCPMWFYYDQSTAHLDTSGDSDTNLCYGCMKKWFNDGLNAYCISFTTKRIGGIPDHFFRKNGVVDADVSNADERQDIDAFTHIGYDLHFNAYGNACILLYNGQLNTEGLDLSLTDKDNHDALKGGRFYKYAMIGNQSQISAFSPKPTGQQSPIWWFNPYTLIGSNNVSLNFDSEKKKRFNFTNLHTPEYLGNVFNAGSGAEQPINVDASNSVYKINKRLGGATFSPEMVPYITDQQTTITEATPSTADVNISQFNHNLVAWDVIYDAHSGVMFENFGGDESNEKYWFKSLWGLLGFTYDQLNNPIQTDEIIKPLNVRDRMHRQSRLTPYNQGQTPYIYTNAYVKSGDISTYNRNSYGAQLFTERASSGGLTTGIDPWSAGTSSNNFMNVPAISVDSSSITLKAEQQPTKMLKPYFLIKSNIVGDMKYIGSGHSTEGGQLLPIVGMVNKENGFGDYYFQVGSSQIFTITQPTMLSEITTSIHDPDMSPARVDRNSCVVYMIQKQNDNNLNVISTLPTPAQKEVVSAIQPPMMTPAEYDAYFSSFILSGNSIMSPDPPIAPPDTNPQTAQMYPTGFSSTPPATPTQTQRPSPAQQSALYNLLSRRTSTQANRPTTFGSTLDARNRFDDERQRRALGGLGGGGAILPEGSFRDRVRPMGYGTAPRPVYTAPHTYQHLPHPTSSGERTDVSGSESERSAPVSDVSSLPRQGTDVGKPK